MDRQQDKEQEYGSGIEATQPSGIRTSDISMANPGIGKLCKHMLVSGHSPSTLELTAPYPN